MINYKLINLTLVLIIGYLIYKTSALWINIYKIIEPLLIGFCIAYALYPFFEALNKRLSKLLSILIIIMIVLLMFVLIIILLIPLVSEIISLLDFIMIIFKKNLSILENILNHLTPLKTINTSFDIITSIIITLITSIYFLIDMPKIRLKIKNYLKNKKIYSCIKQIDKSLKKYMKSFLIIVLISFFEYTIIYYMIGHPNYLLLGVLSSLSNFIPIFGETIVQVLGVLTSFALNTKLGIKAIILALICSIFDGYVLNPLVYGKGNKIHPLIVILSSSFGMLFGFIGLVFSIPISIIIINLFKFFKEENYVKRD